MKSDKIAANIKQPCIKVAKCFAALVQNPKNTVQQQNDFRVFK